MSVSKAMYELGSKRSVIRDLFEYGKKRAEVVGKDKVYDFSLGNPTVPAPECVNETIRDLTQTLDSISLHGYTSAQGDADTRQAMADYLNKTYQLGVNKDNFYMTCGAAASLTITLKAIVSSNQDEVLTVAPFFPEYAVFAANAGAKFSFVSPDYENFQINMAELESKINEHTRAIIINSPNNPSGVVYSLDTIKKLAALLEAKEKEYNSTIYLIADEPYREIVYDGVEVPYATKYYKDTVVCYSFSKSLSLPGERIGYILVPDEATDSKELYAAVCGAGRSLGYVCAPSLMQKVVAKCIGQTGDINMYIENRNLLYDNLTKMGYSCVKPDGAFYLFVKALEDDADAFAEKAKAHDLLVVSANSFGCPGYVRISYCVDKDMIERSLPAFEALKKEYE